MLSNYILYVGLLFSIMLFISLAQGIWQRRIVPGALSFDWLLVFALVWPMSATIESSNEVYSSRVLWHNLSLLGAFGTIATWLLCIIQSLAPGRTVPRWAVGAAFIVPLLLLGVLFTTSWHHLFYWSKVQIAAGEQSWAIRAAVAPAWWMFSTYNLLLCGASLLLTIYTFWSEKLSYTPVQTVAVLASTTLAAVSYLLSILGVFAAIPVDPTPFLFLVAGLTLYSVLFRPRYPTLLPEARDTAFDAAGESMIVLDADHRVMELNPAARHLIHILSGLGSSVTLVGQSIEQILPEWTGLMAYLHSTEKGFETSMQVVYDNQPRHFDVQILPLRNGSNRFLGRLLTIQETTEKEQTAEALRQRKLQLRKMVQQVQQLSSNKTQIVGQLVDELSTPLTNIRFYINLLERDQCTEQRHYLEKLHRELTNLQELLNVHHGSERPQRKIVPVADGTQVLKLKEVVCEAIHSLMEQAQLAGVEIKMDAPHPVQTVGNYQQLVQVTSNLIEHVISHTPRGGCVSVRLYQEHEHVILQVQDTSYVLRDADNAQPTNHNADPALLDSRHTQHVTDLKYARKVVNMHGGHIDVENPREWGHQFTIHLPQADIANKQQTQGTYRFASYQSTS